MQLKPLLLSLALASGVAGAFGEESDSPIISRSVEIISTDGRHYGLNLEPNMNFFFNDEANFVVTKNIVDENGSLVYDEETGQILIHTFVEFPGLKFKEMVLSSSLSGVESVNNNFHFNYDIASGILNAAGFKNILIYSPNGMIEDSFTGRVNDMLQIDIKAYGSGIHIVKVDSETFKLLVK